MKQRLRASSYTETHCFDKGAQAIHGRPEKRGQRWERNLDARCFDECHYTFPLYGLYLMVDICYADQVLDAQYVKYKARLQGVIKFSESVNDETIHG